MASSFLHCSTSSTFYSLSKPKTHLPSHSYRPIKVRMSSIQHQISWSSVHSEVDAHIKQALVGQQPASIFDPMDKLVFEVPRSMAPALCIACCEAVGGQKQEAIPAASALHLMHAAMFTHEYLQLSDQPTGKPTTEHAFEPKVELLTADNMVQFAYQILAGMNDPASYNPDRVLQVTIEFGRAMGSQGMINGQYVKMNLGSAEEKGNIDEAFEKKGGALYSCGAACGAIIGGGSEDEVEKLKRFGLYVGMIHNIMVHDILGKDKRLLKLADKLRFLGLKELEGMKDKNTDPLCSIMDGYSAFLRVQKYQFPKRN